MSLLQIGLSSDSYIQEQQNLLAQASIVRSCPIQVLNSMYSLWSRAFDTLHSDPIKRPQILALLGTEATELFILNSTLTTFLSSQLLGKRNDILQEVEKRLNTLPNFTFHPDGTVTVVPSLSTEQ